MLTIRLYRKDDRHAVRTLAAATAFFGDNGGMIFPDTKLLGYLLTEYFLRQEPQHTWIAEENGIIVGYLTATFRERRLKRTMAFRVIPIAALALLGRWRSLFSRRLWRMVWYMLRIAFSGQLRLTVPDDRHSPAHLHINLTPAARGKGAGDALMHACIAQAQAEKIPNIRLRSTRTKDSCPFFEKHGFTRTNVVRSPLLERWSGKSPVFYMEYFRKI
jgi:GNAT superfamily N-acetyltransferase